ncbi:MAG: hypothetical protein HDS14_06480 [Bacteroides sp.]|nr:hypothetical protein [Bacteroides sp.]
MEKKDIEMTPRGKCGVTGDESREGRYREALGTAIRVVLLAAGLLAVMMLMSESEDLSLGRFIAQKAGGVALLIGVRWGWKGMSRKHI